MKTKISHLLKNHWSKLLSVSFFILLLGAYVNIFAIDNPFSPGQTLNPLCAPESPNCTVDTTQIESDPTVSTYIKGITESYFTNGNTAYSWGDHSLAGYITDGNTNWDNSYGFLISYTETDPIFIAWDKDYADIINTPTIPTNLSDLSDDATHRTVTDTEKSTWNGKQDSLVSGTNIKTINSLSILGSGDLTVGLTSDADFNTKGGTNAGLNLVSGAQYNTFLGYEAGLSSATLSTNNADYNTAIGYRALYSNTKGSYNTANGHYSLLSNTTGSQNTANGSSSLRSNTTGINNTANGYNSLYFNTTGYKNTANGSYSLSSNTTGYQNTANGSDSLLSNTTGSQNTANGVNSLHYNSAGSNGVAYGFDSMRYVNSTTTAWTNYNTAIGYESMRGSTTSSNNTGNYNTALGYNSLYSYRSGNNNTALGYNAGRLINTGGNNTLVGYQAGDNLTTGSNNIAIGYDLDLQSATGSSQMTIGNLIFATGGFGIGTTIGTGNIGIANTAPAYRLHVGNNTVSGITARFQNSTGACDINPTTASLVCSSDINLKKNIKTLTTIDKEEIDFVLNQEIQIPESILEKISLLTPVKYNWNTEEYEIDENGKDNKRIGFIAQEVEQLFPDLVFTDKDIDPTTGVRLKSIAYSNFIPYTIAAIQEMNLKVTHIGDLDLENSWRDSIIAWLGNIENRITDIWTQNIYIKDKICIGGDESSEGECLDVDDVRKIKEVINNLPTTPINSTTPVNDDSQQPEEGSSIDVCPLVDGIQLDENDCAQSEEDKEINEDFVDGDNNPESPNEGDSSSNISDKNDTDEDADILIENNTENKEDGELEEYEVGGDTEAEENKEGLLGLDEEENLEGEI